MKVGILGAGRYGRALQSVLTENGHPTYFYDPFLFRDRTLKDVVDFSDVLVLAIPCSQVLKIFSEFPVEAYYKPLIVATKGFLEREIYEKFYRFEILAGPGFSEDILAGKKVKLTVAAYGAYDEETVSEKIFRSRRFLLDKTEDVFGVMLLSALKNIYAIEAGRRGLMPLSDEFKEYILYAIKESQKVLLYNGGFVESVKLSAGVGDFVLTCGSERSRNYCFGKRLGELEREMRMRNGAGLGIFRPERDRRFQKMIKDDKTTIEGISAAREIERVGVFLPRQIEILPNILRRLEYAIKS